MNTKEIREKHMTEGYDTNQSGVRIPLSFHGWKVYAEKLEDVVREQEYHIGLDIANGKDHAAVSKVWLEQNPNGIQSPIVDPSRAVDTQVSDRYTEEDFIRDAETMAEHYRKANPFVLREDMALGGLSKTQNDNTMENKETSKEEAARIREAQLERENQFVIDTVKSIIGTVPQMRYPIILDGIRTGIQLDIIEKWEEAKNKAGTLENIVQSLKQC